MFQVGDIVKRIADPLLYAEPSNTPVGEPRRVSAVLGNAFWVEGGGSPKNGGGGSPKDGGGCDPELFELIAPAAPSSVPSGECDPTGRDAHAPGAKLDAGKTEFGLIMHGMPRALRQVARVATYGANKYTRDGWLTVPDGPRRYTDAMYRHLNAEACGELHDPDTQLEHAAHAAWNALARLELLLRGQGTS